MSAQPNRYQQVHEAMKMSVEERLMLTPMSVLLEGEFDISEVEGPDDLYRLMTAENPNQLWARFTQIRGEYVDKMQEIKQDATMESGL